MAAYTGLNYCASQQQLSLEINLLHRSHLQTFAVNWFDAMEIELTRKTMTIAREAKLVVRELSPILAGFKLAAIVISYIGFGSVAKWFVEYWYPFTRKLWDWITASLSIPEFTVPVKDSLTALLFFLPLGLTAIYQCLYPPERISSNTYRAFAGILGILFFYLVTKDALAAFIKPDTQLDLVFDMSLILTVLMCLAAYVLHILKNIVEHGQIKSIMLQAAWPNRTLAN